LVPFGVGDLVEQRPVLEGVMELQEIVLTEEDQHGVSLLESLLRHYYRWASLVEDEGVYTLTVEGIEFHFFDILQGAHVLQLREKESVKVLYIDGLNVTLADQLLHYVRPAVSAKAYAQSGLQKLYLYQKGVRDGSIQPAQHPRLTRWPHHVGTGGPGGGVRPDPG